ncbi:unnamed protein product [Absidia cylindrospora]
MFHYLGVCSGQIVVFGLFAFHHLLYSIDQVLSGSHSLSCPVKAGEESRRHIQTKQKIPSTKVSDPTKSAEHLLTHRSPHSTLCQSTSEHPFN